MTQGVEMMIGAGVAPEVAGSRIVEGGGLAIPFQGVPVHVMLVLVELKPRASMTAPAAGTMLFTGFRTQFSTVQKFRGGGGLLANMLASMKAGEFVT